MSTAPRRLLRIMLVLNVVIFTVVLIAWSQGLYLERAAPIGEQGSTIHDSGTTYRAAQQRQLLMENAGEVGDNFHISLGMRDRSQRYLKHPFVETGTDWKALSEKQVCLATHASVDHLHHLLGSVDSWKGPISVSVFTPDIDYQLTRIYINYLRSCFPELRRKVSFHLVYPVERPARSEDGHMSEPITSCATPAHVALRDLLARRPTDMMSSWRNKLPYPQNLMRNVARATCPGEFVTCPDVDMVVTVDDLDGLLAEFLRQQKCKRCAFVIPVYEVRENQQPPSSKTQLLRLVKNNKARPFHLQVFRPNQALSNLPLWEKKGQDEMLNVSHTIEKFAFPYEPVYVARRDVPDFDERFVGFGNTRNTQAYEMSVAGWQYSVLNNAFLVHWGYQRLSSRPSWRYKQASTNSRRFPGFVREVAVRYDKNVAMLRRYSRGKFHLVVEPKNSSVDRAAGPAPNEAAPVEKPEA